MSRNVDAKAHCRVTGCACEGQRYVENTDDLCGQDVEQVVHVGADHLADIMHVSRMYTHISELYSSMSMIYHTMLQNGTFPMRR